MTRNERGILLIGSGPSLNRVEPRRLACHDTIAFNRSYLAWPEWGFAPTCHACLDPRSMAIIAPELPAVIRQYPQTHFFLHADAARAGIAQDRRVTLIHVSPAEAFARSPDRLADFGNVGATSLQLLALMGYRRVLLVGVDGVYVPDGDDGRDPNHFRPDYAVGRAPLTDADRTRYTGGWAPAARECGRLGIEVRNASEGTALSCFPTIDFAGGLRWLDADAANGRARAS
jgi:hypothetical protein